MKTAMYSYILNQYLMGNFHDAQLPILVANKHITDADRLEMVSFKSGVA